MSGLNETIWKLDFYYYNQLSGNKLKTFDLLQESAAERLHEQEAVM